MTKPIQRTAKTLFCLLVFSCCFLLKVEATHIIGGEIASECLGNDQYRITMYVSRDCNAFTQFDQFAPITIYQGNNISSTADNFLDIDVPIGTIDFIDPNANSNPCLIVPPGVCVERGFYQTVVTLPYEASGYHVTYQRCCRNGTIDNIFNPDNIGGTYTIFISGDAQNPNPDGSCGNTSPSYLELPPIVICANNPLVYDHSAFDPDGDSLVYAFCTPLVGGSPFNPSPNICEPPPYGTVNFIGPTYTTNNPLGANPSMNIDPQTGLMTGTPTIQGQFVVGVCVSEFRNGVLLSQSRRDFQFNVATCTQVINADVFEDFIINLPGGDQQYVIESCGDTTISFLNESGDTNFISDYRWEFYYNGNLIDTSVNEDPTITFPDTGVYTGILVLNPGNIECTDTGQLLVIIHPGLEANVGLDYDSCSLDPVTFSDSTLYFGDNFGVSYTWDFADGNTSTLPSPVHQYDSSISGNLPIVFSVTDDNGCSDDTTFTFEYFPTSFLDFEADTFAGCAPFGILYNNTSYPLTGYTTTWYFGDGDSSLVASPLHVYEDPGDYTVMLFITSPDNGCVSRDTFENLIHVETVPQALYDFTFDTCAQMPIEFVDLSTDTGTLPIITWQWNFDDGDSIISNMSIDTSHQFDTTGIFNVSLIVLDSIGCTDTASTPFPYYPASTIDFSSTTVEGCDTLGISFTNLSWPLEGYTVLWQFGDGNASALPNPTHVYADTGNYTIILTMTSPTGCIASDTFENYISVYPLPVPDFTIDYDTCTLLPVGFNDASDSIGIGGVINQWNWDFGDGGTDTLQNTSHQFDTVSIFNVVLQVTDANGCTNSTTQAFPWFPTPVIDVTTSDPHGCDTLTVAFNNTSAPLQTYTTLWQFGDATTSNLVSPSHFYADTGTYSVQLTMVSPTGCTADTLYEDLIRVDANPTALFNFAYDTCNVSPIDFFDASQEGSGLLNSWDWDFGEGSTSTMTNPTHLFDSAGFLNIQLIVGDVNGCADSLIQQIGWFPNPILDIVPGIDLGCEPLDVFFDNNSYPINGYTTEWDFGDGGTSLDASPTYTYVDTGTYTVIITITAPAGSPGNCISRDTFVDLIRVQAPSTVDFDYLHDTCAQTPFQFQDQSIVGDAPLYYYSWYFGDGDSSHAVNPVHQFDSAGYYDVELVVVDSNGCESRNTIAVPYFPDTDFNIDPFVPEECAPSGVTFNNYSYPYTPEYQINWEFGDNETDTIFSPVHMYMQSGNYNVTVSTTSPTGCVASEVINNILVDPRPTAIIQADFDSCAIDQIEFTDASFAGGDFLTDWVWYFSDGEISNIQNPDHRFEEVGTYEVFVIVRDNNGCYDTSTVAQFEYYPAAEISIEPDLTEGCVPFISAIKNLSFPSLGYEYTWDFGDGSISKIAEPTHSYSSPGSYDVSLTMTSPSGCESVMNFEDLFTVDPQPEAAFEYDPNKPSNFNADVNFTDLSSGAIDWQWFIDSTQFSTAQNPMFSFSDTGQFAVQLIIMHEYGCTDTLTQYVDVEPAHSFFLPNAFTPDEDGLNDTYRGKGNFFAITGYNMQIYNRWGERIFTTTDPEEGWNGKKNNAGNLVPNGVYECIVKFKDARGELHVFTEHVTLIR